MPEPLQTLPFQTLTARCVPLRMDNVDTDQIIPARFLKGTVRTGLGRYAFNDWRYLPDGGPDPTFVLNQPQYHGAQILLAGDNFGSGSSREHAPWALTDHGFRAIIAVSFADIFRNNALKNSLLPVVLPEETVIHLMDRVERYPELAITINLSEQQVSIPTEPPGTFELHVFDIDPFRKQCLLDGVDDIGYSLGHLGKIEAYEREKAVQ